MNPARRAGPGSYPRYTLCLHTYPVGNQQSERGFEGRLALWLDIDMPGILQTGEPQTFQSEVFQSFTQEDGDIVDRTCQRADRVEPERERHHAGRRPIGL